jgi:hypothetical protein
MMNTRKNKTEEIITNVGVRQGCSSSPTLFNTHACAQTHATRSRAHTHTHINEIIGKWKRKINPGIKFSQEISLNVLLYTDDAVIIQKNADDLQ